MLNDCILLPFIDQIKETTIALKQRYAIKVPDAIIAATSIEHNIPIVTADKGFEKITGLKVHIVGL